MLAASMKTLTLSLMAYDTNDISLAAFRHVKNHMSIGRCRVQLPLYAGGSWVHSGIYPPEILIGDIYPLVNMSGMLCIPEHTQKPFWFLMNQCIFLTYKSCCGIFSHGFSHNQCHHMRSTIFNWIAYLLWRCKYVVMSLLNNARYFIYLRILQILYGKAWNSNLRWWLLLVLWSWFQEGAMRLIYNLRLHRRPQKKSNLWGGLHRQNRPLWGCWNRLWSLQDKL